AERQTVAVGQRHGGGAREERGAESWAEQGDSGSRLGDVSPHAGVQASLAWRRSDRSQPTLHLADVPRVWACVQTESSATSLVLLCRLWLYVPCRYRRCQKHSRPGAQGEAKRLLVPLGTTGILGLQAGEDVKKSRMRVERHAYG